MRLRPLLLTLLILPACGPCSGSDDDLAEDGVVDAVPEASEAPSSEQGAAAPANAGTEDSPPAEGSGEGALFPGCEPYIGMAPTDCVTLQANLCVKMVCRGCATMADNIDACGRGESICEPEEAENARRCGAGYVQCLLDAGCDGDHREDGARQAACSSAFQMCAANTAPPAPIGQ